MSYKVKRYWGEILVAFFAILSSFLLFPLVQKIVSQKQILDLDIYNIIMYILIIILPVVFRVKLLKNSIQHSVIFFWVMNSLAMIIQMILCKFGYMTNIIGEKNFFNIIIYIIILSIIQSSIAFVYFKRIIE